MDRSSAISQLESILCKALDETLLNLLVWYGYVRAALLQDVVEERLHTMMGCCETSCIQYRVSKQSACKNRSRQHEHKRQVRFHENSVISNWIEWINQSKTKWECKANPLSIVIYGLTTSINYTRLQISIKFFNHDRIKKNTTFIFYRFSCYTSSSIICIYVYTSIYIFPVL